MLPVSSMFFGNQKERSPSPKNAQILFCLPCNVLNVKHCE